MPREPDWMDFGHALDKKREAIQDSLPAGVECWLSLASYGHGGALFHVTLTHHETGLGGHGSGRTPAKALEAAKEDLAKAVRERKGRPQLVGAKTLPPAKDGGG